MVIGEIAQIIIPAVAAGAAAFSAILKNWLAKKRETEIVINMGDGSKITVDGSEETRERVRKVLSETFGPDKTGNVK
jgi:hypothetical protein